MSTRMVPDREQGTSVLRLLGSVLGVLVIVGAAWLLWPASLRGRAQFVIVQGTSMEPTYHSGDLLYARKSADYEVGDIAVYAIPEADPGAGALVVHRIVAEGDSGEFQFKGDNRDSLDDARPNQKDLVAKPVTNLGQFPTKLLILTPLFLSIILGAAVAWFLWPARPDPALPGSQLSDPPDEPQKEPETSTTTNQSITAKRAGLASEDQGELASVG